MSESTQELLKTIFLMLNTTILRATKVEETSQSLITSA